MGRFLSPHVAGCPDGGMLIQEGRGQVDLDIMMIRMMIMMIMMMRVMMVLVLMMVVVLMTCPDGGMLNCLFKREGGRWILMMMILMVVMLW